MKLRKFYGTTSRAVLQQVRNELGPDAVIVANRSLDDGIEITALANDGFEAMLEREPPGIEAPRKASPQETSDDDIPTLTETAGFEATTLRFAAMETQQAVKVRWDSLEMHPSIARTAEHPELLPVVPAPLEPPTEDPSLSTRLLAEVSALRGLLEDQLGQLAWSDTLRRKPLRARVTRDLIASGYSARLARNLSQQVSEDCAPAQASDRISRAIARELKCLEPTEDIVAAGGVYALVGPTGVGKTTTVAKIAARCAVRYGAQSIALLTTDSYRVGAHDHLRIFARILGVTVHTVADGRDLRAALELLNRKHFVLIDTVGMGQRDARLAEQSTLLAQPTVRRMLLLNATAQSETLEEVVNAYGGPEGLRAEMLAGCIITKLDEAARPGHVLDVVIRHRLPLLYVSNGQRVPEDLHPPSAAYLAHRSLRRAPEPGSDSPFALHNDELGCLIGAEAANV